MDATLDTYIAIRDIDKKNNDDVEKVETGRVLDH